MGDINHNKVPSAKAFKLCSVERSHHGGYTFVDKTNKFFICEYHLLMIKRLFTKEFLKQFGFTEVRVEFFNEGDVVGRTDASPTESTTST